MRMPIRAVLNSHPSHPWVRLKSVLLRLRLAVVRDLAVPIVFVALLVAGRPLPGGLAMPQLLVIRYPIVLILTSSPGP